MKRLSILTLWVLLFGTLLSVSKVEVVQANAETTAQLVAILTAQGIRFFQVQADNELQPVGELPPKFGLEGISNTEWLISSISNLVISPSGNQIAFSAHRNSENALFIYGIVQKALLEKSVPYLFTPIWSPDGKALILSSPPVAFVYQINSDQLIEITDAQNELGGNFDWLPDSLAIFYVGLNTSIKPPHREIYLVNRDGSNRHALTNIASDAPADANQSACNLTWSPENSRIYYVVGCLGFKDNPRDYLFSVNLSGESRLEVSLPTAFNEATLATAVRNVDVSQSGIVFTYQADLLNGDHHWRVVNLTARGELQLRFDYRFDEPRELYSAKISSDNAQVAIVGLTDETSYGSIHLLVGSFSDNQLVAELDDKNGYICNVAWNSQDLLYETTDIPCFGNRYKPIGVWRLNNKTQITNLTEFRGKAAWILTQ